METLEIIKRVMEKDLENLPLLELREKELCLRFRAIPEYSRKDITGKICEAGHEFPWPRTTEGIVRCLLKMLSELQQYSMIWIIKPGHNQTFLGIRRPCCVQHI